MERPADTAALRPPTGLDLAARQVLLRVLSDAGVEHQSLVAAFFRRGHYADLKDYMLTVERVWGSEIAWDLLGKLRASEGPVAYVFDDGVEENLPELLPPTEFLLEIPEPDLLTAIETGIRLASNPYDRAGLPGRLNGVCAARGLPYRMHGIGAEARFRWRGDAVVAEQVVQPALSALDDPRLDGGPKEEFQASRDELRQGTPAALKQAVAEACNAVESALKVLLQASAHSLPTPANLQNLLEACVDVGLIPAEAREIVAAPGRFGNRRGRHGAGAAAHNVTSEEAEAVVAAAAVAVTFIARRLPPL